MRADRLLAELTLIQARGRMTAAELAVELEVTERTVYRDMYALQVAGVPLVAERGRDGGYSLYGDWRADLTGLTTTELESLVVAAASSPASRTGSQAATAAAKLAAMLPPDAAGELSRLRRRIHVVLDVEESGSGKTVSTLIESLRRGVSIKLVLRRFRARRFECRAHPIGMVIRGRDWYLVWHPGDGRPRVDPVDDVVEVGMEAGGAIDPGPVDLAEVWSLWNETRTGAESRYEVRLRMSHDLVGYWQERYAVTNVIETAAGTEVAAGFTSAIEARSAVLPWGAAVEVLSPRALRLSVADFASQTVAIYDAG